MEILRTKSIESIGDKSSNENNGNPNPYIRRYGSHIKSHFSQSRCEIFDSSDEEKGSLKNQVGTQLNSMNSMGSMRVEFNRPKGENQSSLQNLDCIKGRRKVQKSKYRLGSTCHVKNNPSIDRSSGYLNFQEPVPKGNAIEVENDSEPQCMDLDIEHPGPGNLPQNDLQGSRKSSIGSLHSVEFDTNNLIEPGADFIRNVRKENENLFLERENVLEKREGFSNNSTANNSMFRSEGDKIEEEEPTQENENGDLDIES
jgi:hypothetical protein